MTIFDIKFDEDNHDMTLTGSDIAFATETNIVKQRLTIRLNFLLAEWFLDNTAGLPYTQTIFEQGNNLEDIYFIFQSEIKDTEGVDSIEKLDLIPDQENKGIRVNFEVNQGTIIDSVEVAI